MVCGSQIPGKSICDTGVKSIQCSILSFTVAEESGSRTLTRLRSLKVVIAFQQAHIGRYEDRLELVFEDSHLRKRFIIARTLKGIVGDKETHDALKPKSPYVPRSRSIRKEVGDVIKGVKPASLNGIPYVGPLPRATIPAHLQSILAGSESVARVTTQIRKVFLPAQLNSSNYGRQFRHLLWIEEFKME